MRHASSIALLAVLAIVPAFGQVRGGMRASPAMNRPAFGGRPPTARAPVLSRAPAFSPTRRWGVSFGTFGGFGCFGGFNCFGGPFFPGRFRHHHHFFFQTGFFNPFFGFPVAYPYYPGYYPMGLDDSSSQYSTQSDQQNAMSRQIDELRYEVQRLREEDAASTYASAQPVSAGVPKAESRQEPSGPTVLVFKDKHIQEVQNYAIVGESLWVFTEQRAKKVPLSELDLPATAKLNEERGVEFHVPAR